MITKGNYLNYMSYGLAHETAILLAFTTLCYTEKSNKKQNKTKNNIRTYCKFGNFREDFIFAKLRICEVL